MSCCKPKLDPESRESHQRFSGLDLTNQIHLPKSSLSAIGVDQREKIPVKELLTGHCHTNLGKK